MLSPAKRRDAVAFLAFVREGDDGIAALAAAWRVLSPTGELARVDLSVRVFLPEAMLTEPLWERIDGDRAGVEVIPGEGVAGYQALRASVARSVRSAISASDVEGCATDKASLDFLRGTLREHGIDAADSPDDWGSDLYIRPMRRRYTPAQRKEGQPIGMVAALSTVTGLVSRGMLRAAPNAALSAQLDVLRLREDEEKGIAPDSAETGRNIAPVFAAFSAVAWAAENED